MNILNNFLANGWGANWLTGWMANDKELARLAFNNSKNEFLYGIYKLRSARKAYKTKKFVHVGNIKLRITDFKKRDPLVENKKSFLFFTTSIGGVFGCVTGWELFYISLALGVSLGYLRGRTGLS